LGCANRLLEIADMRIWAAAALAMILSTAAARADDLQKALDAVNAVLQKDGGGVVALQSSCPKKDDDSSQYVVSSTVVSVNQADRAVLVDTGDCGGGNGSWQYLVVLQNGAANVVTDAGLGDMSFLADHMYVDGNSLFLYGNRWLKNDPHCCPSKKATLEYNLKTHQHKLTNVGDNKS
jgi:hypothetical protein